MRPGSKEIYKERGGADSLYYQLGIPIPEFPESTIHGIQILEFPESTIYGIPTVSNCLRSDYQPLNT